MRAGAILFVCTLIWRNSAVEAQSVTSNYLLAQSDSTLLLVSTFLT